MVSCLLAPALLAQSAADLSARIVIDARLDDWNAAECAFRTAAVCSSLQLPGPCDDEERDDDSVWSRLQDVHQVKVTWDAERLYLGVQAVIADHVLLLLIDTFPGGLTDMADLRSWRRGVSFGPSFRPDFLLVVRDRQRSPELWRVRSLQFLEPVATEAFEATASFQVEASDRALEAALPWAVLFPQAAQAVNPDPLAPAAPMFVLPEGAALQGLRLQAVVVHAADGFGAADVAPDASQDLPPTFRQETTLDRAVWVDWRSPHGPFVAFGTAVQTQATPRFAPPDVVAGTAAIHFSRLDTHDPQDPQGRSSRLLLADAGHELGFSFDFHDAALAQVYVSASIYSMRGEPMQVLYVDSRRQQGMPPGTPWGRFNDPMLDRWGGDGRRGTPVDAGMYLLRVTAGPSPGVVAAREQRTIVVVR